MKTNNTVQSIWLISVRTFFIFMSLNFLTLKSPSLLYLYAWSVMGVFSKYDSYIHLCDPVHLFSVEIWGVLNKCIQTIDGQERKIFVFNKRLRKIIKENEDCMWAFCHIVVRFTESKRIKKFTFMVIVKMGKMPCQQRSNQVVRDCWSLKGHRNRRFPSSSYFPFDLISCSE